MEAVLLCNRALCYLKLESYENVVRDCTEFINIFRSERQKNAPIFIESYREDLRALSVKAYYRRAMAFKALGKLPSCWAE